MLSGLPVIKLGFIFRKAQFREQISSRIRNMPDFGGNFTHAQTSSE